MTFRLNLVNLDNEMVTIPPRLCDRLSTDLARYRGRP